ncbi:MAG TPA: potassium-transporting ATPase subunit C [Rectinemataceae bacterium]|nr:potassium-transporting ATPase subunit C [Rectinemataceae bacterium]
MKLRKKIPTSIAFLFWMTILVGVLYPLAVTGIAQLAFRAKANGSLVVIGGQVKGSRLLAQEFKSERFFKPRPSATGYAYIGSAGSNLAPTNAALGKAVKDRDEAWLAAYGQPAYGQPAYGRPATGQRAPADMRYASGSGLDPDISLEAALDQLDSVSTARGLSVTQKTALEDAIRKAVASKTTIVGSPRLNVVELNVRLESDPLFAVSGK